MDSSEQHVSKHFSHRGFTDIVYEPDGNIPPDFLVNSHIAVEVRRLNQNHFDADGAKGLEEVAIPLWNKIKAMLAGLGGPVDGESWFIYFRYSRPVEPWSSLKPQLQRALQAFISAPNKSKGTLLRAQGFELDVFRAGKPHATMFLLGGCSDEESGGWLLSEMEVNIRHCASEKSRKIAKVKAKYEQWWLALVDHIGYGLDDFDRQMFRDQVCIEHDWDKIVIIDPNDHTRWFEI